MRTSLFRAIALLTLVPVMGAASCGSRVETQVEFPPAPDLKVQPEPAFPEAALEPSPAGEAAKDGWNDDVLIWGREGWGQVGRLCRWSREMGNPLPKEWCDPPAPAE